MKIERTFHLTLDEADRFETSFLRISRDFDVEISLSSEKKGFLKKKKNVTFSAEGTRSELKRFFSELDFDLNASDFAKVARTVARI